MSKTHAGIAISLLGMLLTGCARTESRTYDLTVRNHTAGSVTLWLYKVGPVYEDGWKSPEDFVIESPRMREPTGKIGGVILEPGQVADTGPRQGKFGTDSVARLRVYRGEMSLNQMLANGADSPDRLDHALPPGKTRWVVTEKAGKLQVLPDAK
jgi:hypothetical protein